MQELKSQAGNSHWSYEEKMKIHIGKNNQKGKGIDSENSKMFFIIKLGSYKWFNKKKAIYSMMGEN